MFRRIKSYVGLGDTEAEASLSFSLVAAGAGDLTLIKDSPGVITAIHAINVAAAIRYLKFYDTKFKPAAAGKGIPVRRFGIPGSTTGAGFTFTPVVPLRFNVGIAFTLVTGSADTDTTAVTAGDVILTIEYV